MLYPNFQLPGCLFFPAPSGGKRNILIQVLYPGRCSFRIYIYGYWGPSSKPQEWWLAFSCTFRRETPFGNEVYLSKYLGSCNFRIYMVMGVYLQNPRSGDLHFPAPSGGRCPLEMKYTYPSTLGHVVSEYTVYGYGGLSPKP